MLDWMGSEYVIREMLSSKKKLKKKKTTKKSPSCEVTQVPKPLFEFTQTPRPVPGEKLLAALQGWGNGRQISIVSDSIDTERESLLKNTKELMLVFKCVNSNNTGFLNEIEVHNALELLGLVINDGGKDHIRKAVALSNGSLSFEGFQKLVSDWHGLARNFYKELKKGFSVIDTDNDGKITAADLREASKLAGLYFTNKELEEMLQVADKNGDHAVDISEFIAVMLKSNLF